MREVLKLSVIKFLKVAILIARQNPYILKVAKRIFGFLPKKLQLRIYQVVLLKDSQGASGYTNLNDILLANNEKLDYDKVILPKVKNFDLDNKDLLSWRVEGAFDTSYSLCLVNRELALEASKVDNLYVGLFSEDRLGDSKPSESFLKQHADVRQLYENVVVRKPKDWDIVSRCCYPPNLVGLNGKLNFLHCYAWEETVFPDQWIQQFNASLDFITVVSDHVKKVLIDNGLTIPCFVVGLGADHFLTCSAKNYKFNSNSKKFKFLHVSSCFPRKGVRELLNAYGKAFAGNDDVLLVIKTFPNPHNKIHQWLKDARSNCENYPAVEIIEEELSPGELKSLYLQCDVLVEPSLAEGFGLPIIEAMICKIPVITTNWSGQTMFCNEQTALLVDYSYGLADTHLNLHDSVWAIPKIRSLAEKMKDAYGLSGDEKEYLLNNAYRIASEYTWAHVVKKTINSIDELGRFNEIQPKIGWISTWNTKCGIATYSKHFLDHCQFPYAVLAPVDNSAVSDESNVSRCWMRSSGEDFSELLSIVERLDLNTVVLQWHPGIFFGLPLHQLFCSLKKKSVKLFIFLHSTTDTRAMNQLMLALCCCDRIVVHSVNDLNRLKDYGIANDKLLLLPHGINKSPYFDEPSCELTIASYGFFMPHKGLLELIEAVGLLHQEGLKVKLCMVNSEFDSDESRGCISQARSLISTLGLRDYVKLYDQFLPDDESLRLLSKAKIIVYPYQKTGESASGAVRYGIASGRTVLVTPLPIFDDVKHAITYTNGFSANDLAESIKRELLQEVCDNELSRLKINNWIKTHDYHVITRRFFGSVYAISQERL